MPPALGAAGERRCAQLVDYQDARLARALARPRGGPAADDDADHDWQLTQAVAEGWFKLLTYKDEYEVAGCTCGRPREVAASSASPTATGCGTTCTRPSSAAWASTARSPSAVGGRCCSAAFAALRQRPRHAARRLRLCPAPRREERAGRRVRRPGRWSARAADARPTRGAVEPRPQRAGHPGLRGHQERRDRAAGGPTRSGGGRRRGAAVKLVRFHAGGPGGRALGPAGGPRGRPGRSARAGPVAGVALAVPLDLAGLPPALRGGGLAVVRRLGGGAANEAWLDRRRPRPVLGSSRRHRLLGQVVADEVVRSGSRLARRPLGGRGRALQDAVVRQAVPRSCRPRVLGPLAARPAASAPRRSPTRCRGRAYVQNHPCARRRLAPRRGQRGVVRPPRHCSRGRAAQARGPAARRSCARGRGLHVLPTETWSIAVRVAAQATGVVMRSGKADPRGSAAPTRRLDARGRTR